MITDHSRSPFQSLSDSFCSAQAQVWLNEKQQQKKKLMAKLDSKYISTTLQMSLQSWKIQMFPSDVAQWWIPNPLQWSKDLNEVTDVFLFFSVDKP